MGTDNKGALLHKRSEMTLTHRFDESACASIWALNHMESEMQIYLMKNDGRSAILAPFEADDFARDLSGGREDEYVYVGALPLRNTRWVTSNVEDFLELSQDSNINAVTITSDTITTITMGDYDLNIGAEKLSLCRRDRSTLSATQW